MSDAVKALEKVSRSPESQSLAEERQLARFNAALEEQYARRAIERARAEGVHNGLLEAAARLLGEGRAPSSIAELLGLDVAEVEALRHHSRS